MTELIVKSNLSFLIEKYEMFYIRKDFKINDSLVTETYSFYNENGCFTISNFSPRGEVDYIRLDGINSLKKYLSLDYNEKRKFIIDITSVEKEIWSKHSKLLFFKNPLFWLNSRNVLKALAEVIETEIKKTGQFYGIKVK